MARAIAVAAPRLALIVAAATVAVVGCSSSTGGSGENDSVLSGSSGANPSFSPSISTLGGSSSTSTGRSTSPSASAPSPSRPAATTHPIPAAPLRTATVHSVDGKRSYSIKVWAQVASTNCPAESHGTPVVQYLIAHPCSGLTRLLATTTVDGRPVGFAQSSVGFVGNAPGVYSVAGNFAKLENEDGTGSIDDLFADGYRIPDGPSSLPSPDAFDVESQDSAVTIVDAFYLDASTPNNDPALVQFAKDIYLQY